MPGKQLEIFELREKAFSARDRADRARELAARSPSASVLLRSSRRTTFSGWIDSTPDARRSRLATLTSFDPGRLSQVPLADIAASALAALAQENPRPIRHAVSLQVRRVKLTSSRWSTHIMRQRRAARQ